MAIRRNPRPSACVVRKCQLDDVLSIQKILAESPQAAFWSLQAIEDVLRQSWVTALVSEQGGEVTGFLVGRRLMDEGEILNLAIHIKHRKHGHGHALVNALLDQYQRLAVSRLFLEVRESNADAIHFYQSLGFQQTGRRPTYYRDPPEAALLLEKRIGKSTEPVPITP
jgi:[ribosomal protein S18]-alanine N-acetyltransferase